MKKKLLITGASIFLGFILFHIIAFNFISGNVSLHYIYKIVIDFLVGSVLSVPIYWLFFRKLVKIKWWKKLLLHIVVFALYLICWYEFQYRILVILDIISPDQSRIGMYWDYYFAGLYYVIIFGSYQTFYYFSEKQKLKARERELLILAKTSEINTLKAQIRPHFLFNTLNSIVASVPPESEKTRTLITLLADSFRYSLKASLNEYVLISEEVDFIRSILFLEKERFGDRLQYSLDIDEKCEGVLIAPLLIQPLVENAIEHGIAPVSDGGIIMISVRNIAKKIHVEVKNTGGVFSNGLDELFSAPGVGLRNLRDRLRQLYDSDLQVNYNKPNGLVFRFHIRSIAHK